MLSVVESSVDLSCSLQPVRATPNYDSSITDVTAHLLRCFGPDCSGNPAFDVNLPLKDRLNAGLRTLTEKIQTRHRCIDTLTDPNAKEALLLDIKELLLSYRALSDNGEKQLQLFDTIAVVGRNNHQARVMESCAALAGVHDRGAFDALLKVLSAPEGALLVSDGQRSISVTKEAASFALRTVHCPYVVNALYEILVHSKDNTALRYAAHALTGSGHEESQILMAHRLCTRTCPREIAEAFAESLAGTTSREALNTLCDNLLHASANSGVSVVFLNIERDCRQALKGTRDEAVQLRLIKALQFELSRWRHGKLLQSPRATAVTAVLSASADRPANVEEKLLCMAESHRSEEAREAGLSILSHRPAVTSQSRILELMLKSKSPRVISAAGDWFLALTHPTISLSELVPLMHGSDPVRKFHAARVLSLSGSSPAHRVLLDTFLSGDKLALQATKSLNLELVMNGERQVARSGLGHSSRLVRRQAAKMLCMTKDISVVRKLLRCALKDRDQGVRLQAMDSLSEISQSEAGQKILRSIAGGAVSQYLFATARLAERLVTQARCKSYQLLLSPFLTQSIARRPNHEKGESSN